MEREEKKRSPEKQSSPVFSQEVTIVLGLSGGPDSVYLLHQLAAQHAAQKIHLIAAHLDHEWRSGSRQDALFCQQLAQRYHVPFVMQRATELNLSQRKHESLETFGRRLRRKFFTIVAAQHRADYIALAHHADDQAETFLLRLMRGSSLSGLTCMKEIDGIYFRPLLGKRKHELLTFLHENNIPYVTDETNQSTLFARNAVRARVIPELEKIDTRWHGNIQKTVTRLQEAETFLKKITTDAYAQITKQDTEGVILACTQLATHDAYLQKRVILQWLIESNVQFTLTENFLEEIIRFLLSARGGMHQITENWHIDKKKAHARIVDTHNRRPQCTNDSTHNSSC